MCNYRELNKCKVTNDICPWVYWCDKIKAWKILSKAPKQCAVANKSEIPKGYYEVAFERQGYLYVRTDGAVIKMLNPFDYVPTIVKAYKTKNGEWKIRKTKE